jgi:hypothetical protein
MYTNSPSRTTEVPRYSAKAVMALIIKTPN